MENGSMPLSGVRIIDFTWAGAGPLWTRMFAIHGAEVLKIESTTRLDYVRVSPPFPAGRSGLSAGGRYFPLNTGKLGLTLNIRLPQGKELVRRLVMVSDIVADNFSAGVMQRLELGYQDLVKLRPDIIAISMPVMGQEGPRSTYRGMGPQIEALAGIKYLTGNPERPPVGFALAYPDFTCNPYHATVAALTALHHRNETGEGQFIDMAQYESTASMIGEALLEFSATGHVPRARGNRSPYAAPHNAYRCLGDDRWCSIAVFTDEQWRAFCGALGDPEWTREERFHTLMARKAHEDELDALVEQWTSQRDPFQVMQLLQEAGVPAGVVQTLQDLFDLDPQLRHREHYVVVDHPEAGPTANASAAFILSESPGQVSRPAPCLGEHNQYVFKEVLGLPEEEYSALAEEGVIEENVQDFQVARDVRPF